MRPRRPTSASRSGRVRGIRSYQPHRLPSSVATSLQEMGILQPEGARAAPPGPRSAALGGLRSIWQEVEEWPRSVLLFLSMTCFLLLFGLIAWQPWQ